MGEAHAPQQLCHFSCVDDWGKLAVGTREAKRLWPLLVLHVGVPREEKDAVPLPGQLLLQPLKRARAVFSRSFAYGAAGAVGAAKDPRRYGV